MKFTYRFYDVRIKTEKGVERCYAWAHSISNAQLLATELMVKKGRLKAVCIGGATIRATKNEVIKMCKSSNYDVVGTRFENTKQNDCTN